MVFIIYNVASIEEPAEVIYVRKNIKRADAFLESPWFDASERRRHHRFIAQTFVGAGSLMPMQRYSDQQVPLNSKIHNSLRHPNPPIPFLGDSVLKPL